MWNMREIGYVQCIVFLVI